MYGETFYGRHTTQHQQHQSKIKDKKDLLWKKKNTQNHKKTETRFTEAIFLEKYFKLSSAECFT